MGKDLSRGEHGRVVAAPTAFYARLRRLSVTWRRPMDYRINRDDYRSKQSIYNYCAKRLVMIKYCFEHVIHNLDVYACDIQSIHVNE